MSSGTDDYSLEQDRIDQAAAEWIALRYAGMNELQSAEFRRWLNADERHKAAFAELDETWRLLDQLQDTSPARTPLLAPDADLLAPHRPNAMPARKRWFVSASLAVAAALAFGYLGGAFHSISGSGLDFSEQLATEIGHWQNLDLPDGSRVLLNTDSRVVVSYSARERRVRLVRGEANFSVAKNPERPFFVEAGGVAVRAVGTAFNVRLNSHTIEVMVTEGKVSVDDVERGGSVFVAPQPSTHPLLTAGQKVVIQTLPAAEKRVPVPVEVIDPVEIEHALAWQNRRLEFVAVPLREMVREFNRYNHHQMTIADASLAEQRFGGSFRADEPGTFVRLLKTRFGIMADERDGQTVIRKAQP